MRYRVVEADVLRGLAILGVVAIHVSPLLMGKPEDLPTTLTAMAFNQAARFALPAFLFTSGFGLVISYQASATWWSILKRRLLKLLPAYLVWSAIYMVKMVVLTRSPIPLYTILVSLLLGSTEAHLYFVPLLVQAYVLFVVARRWLFTNTGLMVSLPITLIFSTFNQELLSVLPERAHYLFFGGHNILYWLFFFALGGWWATRMTPVASLIHRHRRLALGLTVLSGAAMLAAAYSRLYSGMRPYAAINQLDISVVLFSILAISSVWCRGAGSGIAGSLLQRLGGHTYQVYLGHVLVLDVCNRAYSELLRRPTNTLIYGATASLVVVLVSVAIAVAVSMLAPQIGRVTRNGVSAAARYVH